MSFFGGTKSLFGQASAGSTASSVNRNVKDPEVTSPPSDTVSCVRFSPNGASPTAPTYLAATSWDNRVRVWEVMANGTTVPKAEQMHQAPALSACWSSDGTKVFSVGADNTAQMWDLAANQFVQVGAHDAPIKTVHFINSAQGQFLMTGGWDKKLK